jgi:hypothetical protein
MAKCFERRALRDGVFGRTQVKEKVEALGWLVPPPVFKIGAGQFRCLGQVRFLCASVGFTYLDKLASRLGFPMVRRRCPDVLGTYECARTTRVLDTDLRCADLQATPRGSFATRVKKNFAEAVKTRTRPQSIPTAAKAFPAEQSDFHPIME